MFPLRPAALALTVLAASTLARGAQAVGEPVELAFPLAGAAQATDGVLLLSPQGSDLGYLIELDRVVFADVSLPDGTSVALDVRRIDLEPLRFGVHIDGVPAPGAMDDLELSVWRGTVLDVPGSDVALSFSNAGSYGWIRRSGTLVHLSSQAGPGGDWSSYDSLMITDAQARALGAAPPATCATEALTGPLSRSRADEVQSEAVPASAATSGAQHRAAGSLVDVSIALETDYQYFQVFGSTNAALVYMGSLFGWVNALYEAQAKVTFTFPYVNLYTTPADPWITPDTPGTNCIDMIYELQAAWAGQVPFGADICHLLSGANYGCGVGFLPGLCVPSQNFSVSGNQNGQTPFPVSPNAANLDFYLVCHELGHNFDAIHTHSYCPPIDECPGQAYWGPCQTQQACTYPGTLMSYCHGCGGFANIDTQFHPQSAADMVAYVQSVTCSETFCDALDGSLAVCPCGNAGASDAGCDLQQATGGVQLGILDQATAPQNRATLLATGFPALANPTALVIRSTALDPATPVAFGDGLRCVGVPIVRLGATFATGGSSQHTFGHGAAAGNGTFYYQIWLRNLPAGFCTPEAFNLSNGGTLAW